jgi:dTDP-4-amino-4,6-dideoxygalactose transaminase
MAQLAMNGGPKTVARQLGKSWPIFDEKEEQAVVEVVRSGKWWRGGFDNPSESKVAQFEDAFAAYQHAKHGIAVTNGTQALECALKAVGVVPGDEVIVPALTFVATATAVVLVNAIPVFADIDPATYNISPESTEACITERTRAIVPVHNGGYPCDMDRIMEIAAKHDLTVIEDCAHAHGSEWRGRRVGAIGHMGGFSLQAGKTLTCGEGGIVLTDDDELAEKAYSFHHIGRLPGRPFYEFHRVASNLRMTEFQAAVALAQLSRLDEQTETRERNVTHLARGLEQIDGVAPIDRDERVTRWGFYYWNFHYDEERFDGVPRDKFLEALRAEGVPAGVGAHGAPIYQNPVFQRTDFTWLGRDIDFTKVHCPEAERVHAHAALSLTHRLFLGEQEDMDLILEAIRKIRENTGELE